LTVPAPGSDPFLRAILDHPEEDGPRLVYADWLDEQGDPRGEFIQVQCQRARLRLNDRRRSALLKRERELLWAYGIGWVEEVPDWARSGCHFDRGFVQWVRASAGDFTERAEELFRAAPITEATLRQPIPDAAALFARPELARLRVLKIDPDNDRWPIKIGPAETALLAASPYLASLRKLDLEGNAIGDAGALAVARSPYLAGLELVDARDNHLGPAGRAALRAQFADRVRF
jgi:uncharacterized protein (TIGR02996 family)